METRLSLQELRTFISNSKTKIIIINSQDQPQKNIGCEFCMKFNSINIFPLEEIIYLENPSGSFQMNGIICAIVEVVHENVGYTIKLKSHESEYILFCIINDAQ